MQSDPDASEVREALDELEFVIVQDIFMNKTALHADVILPATSWGNMREYIHVQIEDSS